MQAENAINDLPKDQHIVLGGIIDAFQNQAKLPSDVLRTTLTELNGRLKKQREKIHNNLDMATKATWLSLLNGKAPSNLQPVFGTI